MLRFRLPTPRCTERGVPSKPDYSELRDAVGAIGLATQMLRLNDAAWLTGLPGPEQVRIRAVLRALHTATSELSRRVGSDAAAIAAETARALAERHRLTDEAAVARLMPTATTPDDPSSASGPVAVPATDLSQALRRLEVIVAVEPAPRPLLSLDLDCAAAVTAEAGELVTALYAAIFGLMRSRPERRQPWTVALSTRSERGAAGQPVVVVDMRCEVADDSVARGPGGAARGAALPPWLAGCLRVTEALGGGLTRGRDGAFEVVRLILPAAAPAIEPAANDGAHAMSRHVA